MWKLAILCTIIIASFIPSSKSQDCVVIDGKNIGAECIFPFNFDGVEYNGCIFETSQDQISFEIQYWCSTEVDKFGKHVGGKGSWGHCSSECPLAETDDYEDEESVPCNLSNGEIGSCQPYGICSGFIFDQRGQNQLTFDQDDADECNQGDDSSFVCCPERTTNGVDISTLRRAFGNSEDAVSQVTSVPVDTENNINAKLNEVKRKRKEDNRKAIKKNFAFRSGLGTATRNTPSPPVRSHRLFNRPKKGALKVHEVADELRDVADDTSILDIGFRSLDFNARTVSAVNETCPWTPVPKCTDIFHKKYRTNDGSCNNLNKPNFGKTETPFQRILPSAYSGTNLGIFSASMPRTAKTGTSRIIELPSARLLSIKMTQMAPEDTKSEPIPINTRSDGEDTFQSTTMVMQMGQFIDHDITHSPIFQFDDNPFFDETCCNGTSFPASYDPKNCFPIRVPDDDPFWKGQLTCMEFTRSLTAPNLDCSFGFKEQMNQISHWLDNSNIYGSDARETHHIRQGRLGRMKSSIKPGKSSHPQDLPKCAGFTEKPGMCEHCPACFVAGDERANEQLNLLAFHTIWLREHNRVATALHRLNSNWDDETLFQEARRIVTAEYQHIIYKEWLPLILGKNYMDKFHLWPLSKGHSKAYIDTFDPRVTNEFAAAAFRFGHSLIPHSFQSGVKTKSGFTRWTLAEIFFKPEMFTEHKGLLNDLTEGLTAQHGEQSGHQFAPDIINHLFETEKGTGGMDLVALNIQRGRDHGLPGYNAYREICQVGKARRWKDFEDYISPADVRRLKRIYLNVDDVDLYVGGFLEKRHNDSPIKVGPTFKCIIGDTFARLKMGDRFFYDLKESGTKRFTPRQLRNIRKTSMARILCDNTDITEVQPQAFRMYSSSHLNKNKKRPCNDFRNIPQMDFGGFREKDPVLQDFG